MKKTVLITGACGNIGGKLRQHLGQRYNLKLLDLLGGKDVILADISKQEGKWATAFDGVDVVIHLAGEMRPTASWSDCYQGNVVGTRNVLHACANAGVGRVIYASSNQIMAGYRFLDGPVTSDMEPKPLNPYAISKLISEELGASFALETGISFIALRIGFIQRGSNLPHPGMGIGLWGQQMWLSNNDALRAFDNAINAQNVLFSVLNLISDIDGTRWDMTRTREVIGFEPQDHYTPSLSQTDIDEDQVAQKATLRPGSWLDQYFRHLD